MMTKYAKSIRAEYVQCRSVAVASASSGERPTAGTGDVKTVQLGELIVAVFDEAARWSTSPEEASRLATRVVTRVLRHRRKTVHSLSTRRPAAGGLFIPDTAKNKPLDAIVIAVGNGKVLESAATGPLSVKASDKVRVGNYAGSEVKLDGKDHIILREEDILGTIEK